MKSNGKLCPLGKLVVKALTEGYTIPEYVKEYPAQYEAVAQGIEALLVGELVHQGQVGIGGDDVGRELLPVLGAQLDIAVAAAQDQHSLVRVLGGKGADVLQKGGAVLIFRAHPVVQDGALVAHAGGKLAVGGGFLTLSRFLVIIVIKIYKLRFISTF